MKLKRWQSVLHEVLRVLSSAGTSLLEQSGRKKDTEDVPK